MSSEVILKENEWIVKICDFLVFKFLLRFRLGRLRIHELIIKIVFAIYRKRLKEFYAPFKEQFLRSSGCPSTMLRNHSGAERNLRSNGCPSTMLRNHSGAERNLQKSLPLGEDRRGPNLFIFWLQGYDNAPALVKKCIDSTIRSSNGFTAHLITQENLEEYTKGIPPAILEKIFAGIRSKNNNDFNIQFLSDLLRMWLLSRYGGLWVDATVYHSSKIELPYTDRYYSLHRPSGTKFNMGNGRWSSYYQYSPAGNIVTQFVYEALCYYVNNVDFLMDYLLLDDTIDYAYNNIDAIRQEIDSIPMSNLGIYSLVYKLNRPWDESLYKKLTENTNMFKLSWKIKINYQDKNNFFSHLP